MYGASGSTPKKIGIAPRLHVSLRASQVLSLILIYTYIIYIYIDIDEYQMYTVHDFGYFGGPAPL